LIPILNYKIEF